MIIPERRVLPALELTAVPVVGHDNISVSVGPDIRSLVELDVSITIDREVSFPVDAELPITINGNV
jgi:hypothetical protein